MFFKCINCGFEEHADVIGSVNLEPIVFLYYNPTLETSRIRTTFSAKSNKGNSNLEPTFYFRPLFGWMSLIGSLAAP